MQSLAPIITVPRRFWDREYGGCPLPKAVTVTFEVAGQPVDDVSAHGYVSVAEDSELRLSGLWAVSQDRFPGHLVFGWSRVGDDTIMLQLQPPDSADEQGPGIDRKRQAPTDLSEPQAKLQALSARLALDWDSPREPAGAGLMLDWRPEGRDGARLAAEQTQRLVAPSALLPAARFGQRRGGSAGRLRGGSRATATGRGCAKLVRTTTRLYIGVGQVREWLGEVGARTELQVKVMLDNRMLNGVHQADLLYNKGAHYYWITSRTLKRTAMGKWFLGWNHTPTDGLVLLLRSPSKDEIAAAIAEGFQGKEDDEDTEMSEQQQQQLQLQFQQQQLFQVLSPPSPHPGRIQPTRSLPALAYGDEEGLMLLQQQPLASELEDATEGGQYHRATPLTTGARLGPGGDEDEAVSGLSGDSELRRALGPSDPRLMVAIAAAELQRGVYGGSGTPSASNLGRRTIPATGGVPGAGRGYGGVRDSREMQQLLPGGRSQPGAGGTPGVGSPAYREPTVRTGSEGLNAPGGTGTPPSQPRASAAPPTRFTNFSEVPGGTAFANVPMSSENLGLEPQQQQQQQQRGGAAAMPSQLGATTSIASNLSLAGATQLTGAASMLQASGVAGPIAAPLRLPTNVSELLPPEYLPAAVSVRCTLDGSLQPDIFACEIHRNRHGYCYLYNLPPTVLEGRSQQDWMISEDGCLVLCLKTVQQANVLVENKSVRSNPSNPQGGTLGVGGSSNVDTPGARGLPPGRGHASLDKPSMGRAQRKSSDADLVVSAKSQPPDAITGTGVERSPKAQDPHDQTQQDQALAEDAGAAIAAEPTHVVAALPVERKPDSKRERASQLLVPRQAIESLYGTVLLPHPVLLRYQIDGEQEQQVYLAEVADAGAGELYLRGASMEPLVGRALVGWGRGNVLSHQLLVVCLETRPEVAGQGQGKAGTTVGGGRGSGVGGGGGRDEEPRRLRSDQAPSPQLPQQPPAGQPAPHHHQQTPNWSTTDEGHHAASRSPASAAAANPFGQQQPALSTVTAAPGSAHPPSRTSPQQQQPGSPAPGSAAHRQPQALQPAMSGSLPGVGSSMLPHSLSLMNNASSSLLPAQASNLPFSSSAVRQEGNPSAAIGVAASGRPASAGARGGAGGGGAAGGTAGQRTSNLDAGGGGAMLQAVASATQAPIQAPTSKTGGLGRAAPAAPVYPWEGAAAGQAAPTVFAFGLGLCQEPSSPKGPSEPPSVNKRSQQQQPQQQQQHPSHPQGRGSGGSVLHSVAAESALLPRNTVQTADFSVNVGVHPRGTQGFATAPSHQQSMHQGPRRLDDEAEHELRRSPARGSGELDAAPSNRTGRRTQGSMSEAEVLGLSALAIGGQGDAGPTMRYLPSQGAHGNNALAVEPAGPSGQEAQPHQSRPRGERAQGQSQSWRFDVHPEAQRSEQATGGGRSAACGNIEELPETQPSLTSLPTGGLLREGNRRGDMLGGGCDDGRERPFPVYTDDAYVIGGASGRPGAAGDIDLAGVGSREDEGPVSGLTPSSRPVAEAAESKPASGLNRHSEGAGPGWTGARRAFTAETSERNDVDMEDTAPGPLTGSAPQLGRTDLPLGRGQMGLPSSTEQGDGKGADELQATGTGGADLASQDAAPAGQQHQQTTILARQRRGDGGQALHGSPARQLFEQPITAVETSRPPSQLQGNGAASVTDHAKQQHQQPQSMWFPRLDLTGATASAQEQDGTGSAPAPMTSEEARACGRDEGDSGEVDRPPQRRGVLRMLSMVVHEADAAETQQ